MVFTDVSAYAILEIELTRRNSRLLLENVDTRISTGFP
jgi:hypothetical protein